MFSLKDEKKSIKLIVGITCSLFFLICIFSIFKYMNTTLLGNLSKPDNDDVKFIRSAWILEETGKYVYHITSKSTVFMMPGLSFTLAFFVKIFGRFGGITAYRVLQAVAQTASLYLVFLIGRKVFNSKVGAAAVVINSLCIADYWVTNLILTEGMFKFFTLCLVYFSIYAIEEKKTKYYVFGGISLGLATLFRPAIATFPVIILIMWIIKKYKFKEMVKYAAIVAGIFCLILSPWWIRNYYVFDRFIPLTLASGNPMLQGTYINYDQSTKATDGLNYNKYPYPSKPSEIGNNKTETELSKYRLENLAPKHPLKYLYWYTIGKAKYQIDTPFFWREEFLGVHSKTASIWHDIILVLGLLGAVSFYFNKERNKMGNLIVATIIYFIVAYLPFFTMNRYFYPAMPFVIILAASTVVGVAENHKLRSQLVEANANKKGMSSKE